MHRTFEKAKDWTQEQIKTDGDIVVRFEDGGNEVAAYIDSEVGDAAAPRTIEVRRKGEEKGEKEKSERKET